MQVRVQITIIKRSFLSHITMQNKVCIYQHHSDPCVEMCALNIQSSFYFILDSLCRNVCSKHTELLLFNSRFLVQKCGL
jgi:hypothetical protein